MESELGDLVQLACGGDEEALNNLFDRYRGRLRRMVKLRLNRRLQARVDPSDVIQDAYLEVTRCLPRYPDEPPIPFFLWLRRITGQKLIAVHRQHLGAEMRDASCELALHPSGVPEATSESLAAHLLTKLASPSQAAVRAEMKLRLLEALNGLEPIDREVLALRHFEQLTNAESAQTLQITESAASKRYLRALERLHQIIGDSSQVNT